MAAPSKTQLLNEVHTLLKKRYKLEPRSEKLSVLEAVIYGICHEGTTREGAEQALNRFRDQFFDWNEVRVSSIEEIQGVLAGQPDAEERANRLRRFLRQLFEKTYGFALDALTKKPLKDSIATLKKDFEAFHSDYVLATVIQQGLAGHAMPVDEPIRRGLVRLGIVDEGANLESIRSLLERAIPKNRGAEFVDLMEELTHDTCVEGPPDCPRCELRRICPTGQARLASDKVAARTAAKEKTAASKVTSRPQPDPVPAPKGKTAAAIAPAPAPKTVKAAPAPGPAPKHAAPPKPAPPAASKGKPPEPAPKKPLKGRDGRAK